MRRLLVLTSALILGSALLSHSATAAVKATHSDGASISIPANSFTKTRVITVTGKGFDETVGIYLAYCVVPKAGKMPSPCGGGINKSGISGSSYWISSNPPPYGAGLAIPFTPGGRFSEKLSITRNIGKFDCRKVRCAVTVRSDHLHEGDRSRDLYLPITFK